MSKRFLLAAIVLLSFPVALRGAAGESCADLQNLIKSTYTFKPSKLSKAERASASEKMDKVWKMVEGNPGPLAPCLRAALENPHADPWFRFDGSNLLVSVSPSRESKALQVQAYLSADLDDVEPEVWVETLAKRGLEGFDVSPAGARWLADPKLKYYLAAHGGFEVGAFAGALFLFGSMDEAQARETLFKIANDPNHPGRAPALWILASHATPESFRALKQVDLSGLSPQIRESVRRRLENPKLIEPAAQPKMSREQFLALFERVVSIDWDRVETLSRENGELQSAILKQGPAVPDSHTRDQLEKARKELMAAYEPMTQFQQLFWSDKPIEKDAVAVLKPEDAALLEKIRRELIVPCNQHAIERYADVTQLLTSLLWKEESSVSVR